MIHYVCKYTPLELFMAHGAQVALLDRQADDTALGDRLGHPNLCGFGKAVLQAVIQDHVDQLVLVNCCDVMRRVYDILRQQGCCRFLWLIDLPHTDQPCQVTRLAEQLRQLDEDYGRFCGRPLDADVFARSFSDHPLPQGRYIAILGARVSGAAERLIADQLPLPTVNLTCVGGRHVTPPSCGPDLWEGYARSLLRQVPCRRMADTAGRAVLTADPRLAGIVYHTIKFCDYYTPEYTALKASCHMPITRIETDFTSQSQGQVLTRIQALTEALTAPKETTMTEGRYFAGIDSGSTSTDAAIVDAKGRLVGSSIIPTGSQVRVSASRALEQALAQAGLGRASLAAIVTTGYGRDYLGQGGRSITEISCHAHGAHYLCPQVHTIIDIGGQDSKAIRLDDDGQVIGFAMNDKCAAGTGRFLEMMAQALDLSLTQMSDPDRHWRHDVAISSMCTVFAESEVVSLVAQGVDVDDIIHGLDEAVAKRVAALVGRIDARGEYMITGGVARNAGVVAAIGGQLGVTLIVSPQAQLCGALGAALLAAGR